MPPRPRRERLTLELPSPARVAIVADTHSNPHPSLLAEVRKAKPALILHAGDVGALSVLDELAKVADVLAVRGNVDGREHLPDELSIDLSVGSRPARVFLVHRALVGPKLLATVASDAKKERASLVVCGHSHVPFVGRDRDLDVFNPGSAGPRRFHLPIVFGLLTIAENGMTCEHRDLETKGRWLP